MQADLAGTEPAARQTLIGTGREECKLTWRISRARVQGPDAPPGMIASHSSLHAVCACVSMVLSRQNSLQGQPAEIKRARLARFAVTQAHLASPSPNWLKFHGRATGTALAR
jgi:hypothetical protein